MRGSISKRSSIYDIYELNIERPSYVIRMLIQGLSRQIYIEVETFELLYFQSYLC